MVFNKFKNFILSFLMVLSMFPSVILAYSDKLLVSGDTIGIQIKSKGIMVVGLYKINGKEPSDIHLGDYIIKINNSEVNNIDDMIKKIDSSKNDGHVKVTYLRNNEVYDTDLKLEKGNDGVYKTGLYVKDTINGVGTLTYIDPGTRMYGALGHAIIDKNTSLKVDIKDGKIYKATVTGIIKSENGIPGEKNATFNSNIVFGNITKNTSSGIFGSYTSDIDETKLNLYSVAKIDEIKLGKAKILTVLKDNTIKEYEIEITKLNDSDNLKNISFNITDKSLLDKTGGIVQGMSGSPIIQNDKIIGAVTHVVVNNPTKGYGIYITNMLDEMEKELN